MNTLLHKSIENLKILKNVNKDQILLCTPSRDISIQDEYVQVDNINELESGIHFTFHQLLSSLDFIKYSDCDIIIKDIDQAIDNLYENIHLDIIMENDNEIYEIINNVDHLLENYKGKVFYDSPFYKLSYLIYQGLEYIQELSIYIDDLSGGIRRNIPNDYEEGGDDKKDEDEDEGEGEDEGEDECEDEDEDENEDGEIEGDEEEDEK